MLCVVIRTVPSEMQCRRERALEQSLLRLVWYCGQPFYHDCFILKENDMIL